MRASVPHLLRAMLALGLATLVACGQPDAPVAPPHARAPTYDADGRLSPAPANLRRPNVVLIMVDTLRADGLQPHAEGEGRMPFLSGLARENTWFPQASSTSSWTAPAFASLLTGMVPSEHGITSEEDTPPRPAALTTWAEILRHSAGYATAGYFGGLWPGLRTAFTQGYERSTDDFQLQNLGATLDLWLAHRKADIPFFLTLHTYEAHDPYGAANHPRVPVTATSEDAAALLDLGAEPDPADLLRRSVLDARQRQVLLGNPVLRRHHSAMSRFSWTGLREKPDHPIGREFESAYRDGLQWVDGLLKSTFEQLRVRGLLENTLWIITSDHGEAFGEHGMLLHGRQLYDELVRVPLVIGGVAPFNQPRESLASVSITDVLPTLLDFMGMPAISDIDGRSFLAELDTGRTGRPVLSEVSRSALHTGGASTAEVVAVRSDAWKYIGTLDTLQGTLTEEAYDLRSDPGETKNLAGADGLVRSLPFDAAFCKAVERARDRLWGRVLQAEWTARHGYGASGAAVQSERPPSDCDEPPR